MSLYLGENLISGSKPINLGARNIGELVYSPLPLTDAGLHLLDGSPILGGGIYQGFVDYIAKLYAENPNANYFTTETEWQSSVNTYGVCGKFVYDSTNNTVRLPKVTGIIEGTADIRALGDLVKAGLPGHTHTRGTMEIYGYMYANSGDDMMCKHGVNVGGAFSAVGGWNSHNGTNGNGQDVTKGFEFYASRNWSGSTSNPNYTNSNIQNSSTVQPQTIKCFVYIVIANSVKTGISVDIDNVATDLNSKVDKSDLQEVQCVVETYVNGTSWYRVYSDSWCEQGGYIPAGSTSSTINLLKNYANMDYQVKTSPYSEGDNFTTNITSYPKSVSQFVWNSYNNSATSKIWQACGYIEV